jgi:hypothetical protein
MPLLMAYAACDVVLGRAPRRRHRVGRARVGGLASLLALLGMAGAPFCLSCSESRDPSQPAEASVALDGIDASDAAASARWVTIYDPARASNGYTLAFYRRRIPFLMDMNGHIVHAWPQARVKSRIRLLRDCSLLAIALDRTLVEYAWNGSLAWQVRLEGRLPHHDVIRLANGNTLVVVRTADRRTDDLLEIDRGGEIVWEWRSGEHLAPYFGDVPDRWDITHINSVQELPPNPWSRQGDRRFRAGNLLISARNLDALFVIDKATKQVLWTFEGELDRQHEALLIGPGLPGHGNILAFDNGYRGRYGYRKSTIVEIDPTDDSIVWRYRSDDFFSPVGGSEQPLSNGNVLITSSRGGRAFEVTRSGEIIWQWVPPFNPNRPRRYGYDHCPELAAMDRPGEEIVRPPAGYRHIDRAVYQFAPRDGRRYVQIDGRKTTALRRNNDCRNLLLPARKRILDSGRPDYAARFALRLRREDSQQEVVLLEDTVDLTGPARRTRTIKLDPYAHQAIQLCVETEAVDSSRGNASEDLAYWANPVITAGGEEGKRRSDADDLMRGLTEGEVELQTQHLRALGYLD